MLLDDFRRVVEHGEEVFRPGLLAEPDHVFHHRLVGHRGHGFGEVNGERPQTRAEAAGQDYSAHEGKPKEKRCRSTKDISCGMISKMPIIRPLMSGSQKVSIITLGCAKNQVGTENLSGLLKKRGYDIEADPA